jgi:WD40 repeat protein
VLVLWEASSGRRAAQLVGHTAGIWAVAFNQDGTLALSAGEDRTIRVWDLGTRRQSHALTGHSGTITALAISFDGKLVLSAGNDRTLRLWDLAEARLLARQESAGDIRAVAFSKDGKSVFTGSANGTVSACTVERLSEPRHLCVQSGSVVSLVASPKGALLSASVHSDSRERSLRVIDLATGQARAAGPAGAVEAAAVSRDGRALLAIDKVIHLVSVPR